MGVRARHISAACSCSACSSSMIDSEILNFDSIPANRFFQGDVHMASISPRPNFGEVLVKNIPFPPSIGIRRGIKGSPSKSAQGKAQETEICTQISDIWARYCGCHAMTFEAERRPGKIGGESRMHGRRAVSVSAPPEQSPGCTDSLDTLLFFFGLPSLPALTS